jgi:hypothetical protein
MQERLRPIAPELVDRIKRTISEAMAPFSLRSVEVWAGQDHDGDAVIFVEAHYDLSQRPIELEATNELSSVINDIVWNSGETRFAHVWHRFHEKQAVAKPARRARA